MHRILERQIKQYLGQTPSISPQWKTFLEAVSRTYTHLDEDRALLNHSLDISSKEFLENSHLLKESRTKVEKQAKNLTLEVDRRTQELNKQVAELKEARRAMSNLLEDVEVEKTKSGNLAKDLEKFKLAVDNVSDTIVISDPEGIVIYANRAVEKVTGYKPEEAVGKKSGALWKAPMSKEYYQNLWNTIKTQKKTICDEIKNKRKNGEVYTALVTISPILNSLGEVEFFVAVERDITREKEIDRLKDEFVSIASHELRTPLTAIDGLVSMIIDGEYGPLDKNLQQPLTDISTSSERLIHLVNDLLNLSRIKAGRMKYDISEFSITDVISETVQLLQPVADRKGLQLITSKLEPASVLADCDKVKEILNNLIGNSLKFTDRGRITVSTKISADLVEISVTDTGIGISASDEQRLFGQFQQLDSSLGRPAGTGLGLHISKELVSKMGGNLWLAQSEIGNGSMFTFSLPRAKSSLAVEVMGEVEKETQQHPDQKSDTTVHTVQYGASS